MRAILPNSENAVVSARKIREYLLNPEKMPGSAKARYFKSFGFELADWQDFRRSLLLHTQTCPVIETSYSKYGQKFELAGPLYCPDGRKPLVCTVWQLDQDSLEPRLITAYPLNR